MYRIWLLPSADDEGRHLPGALRQGIKKIIDALALARRPDNSKAMRSPIETSW